MKLDRSWQIRLAQISLGAALVIALVVVRGTKAQNEPVHMTTDWSHHHLVFSAPETLVDRFKASSNPRYVQQWVRRNAEKKFDQEAWRWARAQPDPMKKDWSMNLGFNATMGAGQYPAKFTFDISTANCGTATQPDFVIYNTSLQGNNVAVAATDSGTFAAQAAAGSTITITNGAKVLTMTPGASAGAGTYISSSNTTTEASNLFFAINNFGNGSSVNVAAISNPGNRVNFQAKTAGLAGNSITVSSSSAPNSGFTWTSPTFTGGANGRASIMAFDNLYSGCGGTVPSPYWAYNTGGTANTSVAFSLDGTQVAFVQNVGAVGTLVVLKWKASATDNFNNPTTPLAVTNAAYRNCTAPCMTSIPFSVTGSTRTDTNSAPFIDFLGDKLYVGDGGGRLRKFTGVFLGTPAETTVGGWPVLLGGVAITTSAVWDFNFDKVFIGDSLGFLYSVTASGVPVKVTSGRLGFSQGIVDGPIVDPTAGTVHVFVSNDLGSGTGNANHSRVYQLSDNFTAGSTGASVTVGDSSPSLKAFDGSFDNTYFNSPSGKAGNIYVCGFQAALTGNQVPTLWQIPMAGGTMGTPVAGPALTTAVVNGTGCSPVTEVFNPNAPGGAKDWIFLSVVNHAISGGIIRCGTTGGCIMSFDVTSGLPISAATGTFASAPVTNGTSGVSIDNTVGAGTLLGASQVYFTPLGNQVCTTSGGKGGCAIQASQSGLQ